MQSIQVVHDLKSIAYQLTNYLSTNLVGLVSLILIMSSLINRSNKTIIGAWVANVVGTIFHEIAHFITGVLLGAKPVNFSLIPKKVLTETGASYILGHVDFSNLRWYNSFPVAMSPFLLLFIANYIENNFWNYFQYNLVNFIFYIYLLTIFILNAIPSKQDYKVAFSSIIGFVFWIVVFMLVGQVLGKIDLELPKRVSHFIYFLKGL